MSELFREIEEDIKRERYEKLWKKIGRYAVLGSIGIVALTIIYVAWDNYSARRAEQKTTSFIDGIGRMNAGDFKGAIAIFNDLSQDQNASYYPLAMLQKAQAQESSGDIEGAKKTYKQLGSYNNEYAEIARMKGENLEGGAGIIFKYSLLEKKAWDTLYKGDKQEAAKLFMQIINDENAPRTMAERSSEAVRVIAPEKLTEKVVK